MHKYDKIKELIEFIHVEIVVVAYIECDECFTRAEFDGDLSATVNELYDSGWTAMGSGGLLCPECARIDEEL